MRVLVTGGAGFIGSNLVDRLLAEGDEVWVVDDLSTGSEANLADATATYGDSLTVDLLDIGDAALVDLAANWQPEVVYHLAAQVDVRVSVREPVRDARVNLVGSVNVLEAARAAGVRTIVYAASGGTLYGDVRPEQLPVREHEPWAPRSPYGASKRAVLDYLATYADLYGMGHVSLALANVYGPRQAVHGGEAAVVAAFAERMLAGQPGVIFGDGSQTRDLVYVDDVVEAFVGAAGGAGGGVVNIGSGVETSVRQLHTVMAGTAGVPDTPELQPARPGEVLRSALAVDKARAVLGWLPVTTLAEGVARTLKWAATRTA
ncbi:MAG TPA: NAD-dependent epimerase/dehydratase family protein [Acidimicrobiales bacterium]